MELIICLSAQGKGSLEKTNATPPQSQECKKKVFFQSSLVNPAIRGSVFQEET